VLSGTSIAPEVGNALPLSAIPLGTIIHNIEIRPGAGAALARSAGTYAQLLARDGKYGTLKMPSGRCVWYWLLVWLLLGSVSNADHMNVSLGKAGRNRWMGRRPRTEVLL
jgi:large subunit ribosomal protein L2